MSPVGPMARAEAAWGEALPEWVADLARECHVASQNKVAARMEFSAAVISQVLANKYPGDLAGVEEVFNGVFNNATVTCPALGTLPSHQCRQWREKARNFVGINSQRVQMYRACHGCARFKKEAAA